MTKLRLVLLATTALTVMQFATSASHAQTSPLVVAQAQPKEETGPDGKPKPRPERPAPGAPAHPAPPAAAPHPQAPPPAAAPAAHPAPPPAAAPARPTPPPPPPAAAAPAARPGAPPAAAPARPAPPPPPAAPPPIQRPHLRHGPPPAAGARPGTPPAATTPAAPAATPTPPAPGQQGRPATPPGTPGTPGAAMGAPGATPAPAPAQAGRPATAPGVPPAAAAAMGGAPAPTVVPGSAAATPPPGRAQYAPPTVAPAFRTAPAVTAPLPPPPRHDNIKPLAIGAAVGVGVVAGAIIGGSIADLRGQRQEVVEDGRTIYTEPDRVIIRDPSGQAYVRGDDVYRFRYGARDIRTETIGGETRTIVVRPDGSQIITVVGADGQMLRRIRRDPGGRELVIIDNSYRDPRAVGGFYVDVPPPVVNIPYDRYIVDAQDASPDVIYETMEAPPVQRIDRRYSLEEIRYSPNVRMQMPSIDLNTINFDSGSWTIPPDQAARLQVIADGLNRAIQRNPREVFLIEGHTDATGNDTDNLSLSDRRAQSAAELLTQQFGVPAENLTSQGYGSQYLKEQTDGPSRINRRVTVRRITPLLNGGTASAAPR
ncbi:OmpA family protein [Bradyrhizobium elkanii]|uniref:OmpA family protein n=1 Tax=Bradyrhizobium elkanii TaxID=29448 RepID=UPI0009BBC97C|nr:OmpA family protein [Bradyrhizobium elkanii]